MSDRKPDIGYIPTEPDIVNAALTLAGVTAQDIVYDLGSGDGRIAIAAAVQYGARAIGIDIDSERIRQANENASKAGVSHRVEFRHQDLYHSDFREATVVFLYLLPHLNLKLKPQLLAQLKSGTRIVSHDFDMGDWQPQQIQKIVAPEEATLYYWIIPEQF
jgi:ribosomal protein L11 methylase PrmA